MGRLQHLERLALGRSAYQPEPAIRDQDQVSSEGLQTTENDSVESSHSFTVLNQQYDLKGRPVNLESDAQRARLRHASNEILALVGVVERKEYTDAVLHRKIHNERVIRQRLHTREDNRGNEWSAFLDVVSWFALWWPASLVRRIQIGLYSTDLPFAQILQYEAKMMFGNGWRGVLLGLLPGTGISILHKVLWQVLALIIEESIGAIQNRIVVSDIRRRKARVLIRSLTIFVDIVLVAIDVLLLPLETYALARQLNIAPPASWRPLLTTHLPSFIRITYTTAFSSPASFLTSAAPFLVGYSFLTRDPSPEAPAFSDLTSHRLPSISEHPNSNLQDSPSALRDPFGAILHQTGWLRQRFLQYVGWDVHEEHRPGATNGWETDVSYLVRESSENLQTKAVKHRSTSLARLPAMWLGLRVDMFLLRILLLPLESMVMRKVLQFYLTSGMTVTKAASSAGVGVVRPGILRMLAGNAATKNWRSVAGRVSQLGLSMALNLGAEAVFFGFVYAVIRRQGIRSYEWGQCGDQEEDEGFEDALDL
jgi:hypothetical protein